MLGRLVIRQDHNCTHNSHRLSKGRNECIVLILPHDADSLKIQNEVLVRLQYPIGQLDVEAEVYAKIILNKEVREVPNYCAKRDIVTSVPTPSSDSIFKSP